MAVMRKPAFRGRMRERQALDHLLESVRGGESAVRVLRGEAGIGKTALLGYCARQAVGCRLAQIAGVESELALPWAALHQLCAPLLDGLPALPEPQQQALRLAFGTASGGAPDRFLVGLAVLGLLAEASAQLRCQAREPVPDAGEGLELARVLRECFVQPAERVTRLPGVR